MDLSTLLLLALGGYVIYNAMNQAGSAAQQSAQQSAPTQTGGSQVPVLTPQPTSGAQAPGSPIISTSPVSQTPVYVPPPAAPYIPPPAPNIAQQTIVTGDTVEGAIAEANDLADRMTSAGVTPDMLALYKSLPQGLQLDQIAAQYGWSMSQVYAMNNYVNQLHAMGA